METILLMLPTIFSFTTGVLIAWGIYLMLVLSSLANIIPDGEGKQAKKWCIFFLAATTFTLFSLLFIFPTFAAFHISTIIFVEIWYATFLYRVNASPWSTPCHELMQKLNPPKIPITIQK